MVWMVGLTVSSCCFLVLVVFLFLSFLSFLSFSFGTDMHDSWCHSCVKPCFPGAGHHMHVVHSSGRDLLRGRGKDGDGNGKNVGKTGRETGRRETGRLEDSGCLNQRHDSTDFN